MVDVFQGESYKNLPTAVLTKHEFSSFEDFCTKCLSVCQQGEKNEYYITIGSDYTITEGDPEKSERSYLFNDHYHRNNRSQLKAWLLPFDGDSSFSTPGSSIEPILVHNALKELGFNHAIYTTHSHIKGTKNRWRLFLPCSMDDKKQLFPTSELLLKKLQENGCEDLAMSNESKTWSIPWFLPSRENASDGQFEYYSYFDGVEYVAEEPLDRTHTPNESGTMTDGSSPGDMIQIICTGGDPLHETIRNYIYGALRDGRQPAWVKAELHAFTAGYDMNDPRLKNRKEDIDRMVDISFNKQKTTDGVPDDWQAEKDEEDDNNDRNYTRYPDQGGMMEKIVQSCMDFMVFPNRQIAVTASHALISTLGGRVYSVPNGGGIVLTALITGRSTIGKSFVKKFCVFALNKFIMGGHASDFLGSHFYTSSKNLVKELGQTGSLLSVRTESGQTDQSTAGDMKRVMVYELEMSTESGPSGYISSGGQNDKIEELFSPAMTTIRESVAEIQHEADTGNQVNVSGISGRRSHILIDSVKAESNDNPITVLPKPIAKCLLSLYTLAKDERRKDLSKPLADEVWVHCKFENPAYFKELSGGWREKDNEAAQIKDHYRSTFYGRLYERVPAFAARLAIVEDAKKPIMTNEHLDIAVASLTAEMEAIIGQQASGELDGPWGQLTSAIMKHFKGDMTQSNVSAVKRCNKKMLQDGGLNLTWLLNSMAKTSEPYKFLKQDKNFHQSLKSHLEGMDIEHVSKAESLEKYGTRARIFRRVK